MGLISCPRCGKTVSEKATVCPHCNLNLTEPSMIICEDCRTEYENNLPVCPNCGCPNLMTEQKKSKKKRKKLVISVILIVLIIIGLSIFNILKRYEEAEYYYNMENAVYTMLDGAAEAEKNGNLIKSVWNNAIYEKSDDETDKYTMENGEFVEDFNDALDNLFADEDFANRISKIRENQSEVLELIKNLKNPPKKYDEAYSVLEIYYNNYLKMTKEVINPTGSLKTFSENFNKYDSDAIDSYDKMKLYLD